MADLDGIGGGSGNCQDQPAPREITMADLLAVYERIATALETIATTISGGIATEHGDVVIPAQPDVLTDPTKLATYRYNPSTGVKEPL